MNKRKIMKDFWLFFWPVMLANLSAPLVGLVDIVVVGTSGASPLIVSAVATGTLVLSILYWSFGVIRMRSASEASEAYRQGSKDANMATLLTATVVAILLGVTLWLFRSWVIRMLLIAIDSGELISPYIHHYYDMRIYGAPAALGIYAITGWLIGMRRLWFALILQISLNGINLLLDIMVALLYEPNPTTVSVTTVIAEYLVFLGALTILRTEFHWPSMRTFFSIGSYGRLSSDLPWTKRVFSTLRNILDSTLRSMCLVFVFSWLLARSNGNELLLLANVLLMHYVTFFAFFLDALGFSLEIFCRRFLYQKRYSSFKYCVRFVFLIGLFFAILFSLFLPTYGVSLIGLLFGSLGVVALVRQYSYWAALIPILSVWSCILDGIFFGASRTWETRNTIAVALLLYLGAWISMAPLLDVHGLWIALCVFFAGRSILMVRVFPRFLKEIAQEAGVSSKDSGVHNPPTAS